MIPIEQIRILQHSLGMSSRSEGGYRNFFMASEGGPDLACCLDLVNQGLMFERQMSDADRKYFPYRCFHCTESGIAAASKERQ